MNDFNALLETLALPIPVCESWCEEGDVRHAQEHPEDRSCWSTYQVVPLSRHEPSRYGGNRWLMSFLNVYLRRLAGEEDTVLYLHSEHDDREMVLTLAEATKLRKTLDLALALAGAPATDL